MRLFRPSSVSSSTINNVYNQPSITQSKATVMPFSRRYLQLKSQYDNTVLNKPTVEKEVVLTEEPKKMNWGPPTWFLFHALAYKIKDEEFDNLREELIDIIILICNNLPCPICANHASLYMKNFNFNTIKTKKDLQDMLYNFHNSVNNRKQYPIFPYEQLDEKYSKAVTKNIIYNFISFFQEKHFNVHMIIYNLHRNQLISKLKVWFNLNIDRFSQ